MITTSPYPLSNSGEGVLLLADSVSAPWWKASEIVVTTFAYEAVDFEFLNLGISFTVALLSVAGITDQYHQ